MKAGTVRLGAREGNEPWQYVGKFGYAIGKGTWEVRAKVEETGHTIDAAFQVFLDEDWEDVASMAPCSEAAETLAKSRRSVKAAHGWGPWIRGSVRQNVRPHIWYFALSGCGWQANSTFTVDYELRLRQADGSELSFELRHMPLVTLLSVVCLSVFLAVFARRCRDVRQSAGRVHSVILALGASVVLQWSAQVLHLVHLQLCERDGMGRTGVETLAESLFMLSQVASSTLLLLIAKGYTLVSGSRALGAVKPVAAVVALLQVALVGHCKMEGDLHNKHHQGESAAAVAILSTRVLLFAWFTVSLKALRQQSSGIKLRSFLQRFQRTGALYFLSYPGLFLVARLFAPYLRHPVMHFGLVAAQTVSALWLSDLFFARGLYFEVSTLGGSLLPGGAGCSPTSSKLD